MNPTFCAVAIMSAVLLLSESGQTTYAQSGKSAGSHAGGVATSHMSEKGLENTNAQWSTDSERGRLRAEERHKRYKKGKSQASEKPVGGLPAKAKSRAWDE